MTSKSDKNNVSSLRFTYQERYSGDNRFSTDMGDAPHLVGTDYL